MDERKFVCKFCNKRFPCGKSLGGHIRTHMTKHSAHDNEERSNADALKFDAGRKRKRDLGSEVGGGGNPIYGLRENPKKTVRFVHSNATLQHEKFCKYCGKGFASLKALCGHMACHSEKEKGTNKFENNSGLIGKQKLVMDSQSDAETFTQTLPKRSKRMRFKTLGNHLSSCVVEQEQEEVARCLMLLSKDSSHRNRFALVTESSDNNSVVLEAKSTSADMRITINNGKNSASNAYELVEKKLHKDVKLKSAEIGASDKANSGHFKYGPKKVSSDVSNDGFCRNDESKTPKVGDTSGFEDYDVELRKMLNKGSIRNTEFRKLVLEDLDYDRACEATKKFDSRKRSNYDSLSQNLDGVSSKKTANGFTNDEICEHGGKWWKFECLTSESDNASYDSTSESDENSTDTDSYPSPKPCNSNFLNGNKSSKAKTKFKSKKKSREHECPICCKIFRSSQALGGHKRSHFVGGSKQNTLVMRQGVPVVPCLIDLNQPATVDE